MCPAPSPPTSSAPSASPSPGRPPASPAIVLTGGGARGAYQVGVLRALGRAFPDLRFPIVTGISAGAINAAFLASHVGTLTSASEALGRLWRELDVDDVVNADLGSLAGNFFRWTARLGLGGLVGGGMAPRLRGLLDTAPLDRFLARILIRTEDRRIHGIEENLDAGHLRAVAVSAVNYGTGQTVHFVEGRGVTPWRAPSRYSRHGGLTLDHVMASAALPILFPAVQLGDGWYGDGGIRMSAPLAPALRLGADRLLAISTRYDRSQEEADRSVIDTYPPPAQIAGNLMNAIFLDVLDQDVERLETQNRLLRRLPPDQRDGLAPVDWLVVRPSVDLGKLAREHEPRLPRGFRSFTRSFGTRETRGADFLSLLMFQPDYVERLMEIGEADADARIDEVRRLIEAPAAGASDTETSLPPTSFPEAGAAGGSPPETSQMEDSP
ncbi:MAG: patatin-like phospholipase family protein [Acidobacteriota bacterium]